MSGSGATTNLAVTTSDGVVVSAGGSIGANLTAVNTTIPDYMQQLDSVADSLATNLNALQGSGMDAAGDPGSTIAGGYPGTVLPPIFVNNGSTNTYTTASGTFNSAATIKSRRAARVAVVDRDRRRAGARQLQHARQRDTRRLERASDGGPGVALDRT